MSLRFTSLFLRPSHLKSFVARYASGEKNVVVYDTFASATKKDRNTYLEMIKIFEGKDIRRRGHVEFIYAALRNMEEFGVNKDLEVYKSLVEVLPKGRFLPTNLFQAEFMHYPKQQQCAVDLLEQMEDNGVMPDFEMEDILMNIFGARGIPLRKFWRMMYWMPKFRNLSPWRIPHNLPKDTMELAILAIERISSVDNNMKTTVFHAEDVEDSLDKTWLVSAQCPTQIILLENELKLRKNDESANCEPLVVRGAYSVFLRDQCVSYFTLTCPLRKRIIPEIDPDDITNINSPGLFGNTSLPALKPSVHEQDDGTILAICATGTSSRDSLLSWIRILEKNGNPALGQLPVIFTLTAPFSELMNPEAESAIK